MALNKVGLLSEDQLLKLVKEAGYDEIAVILSNRNINGQRLLELSEMQAISWKLSPARYKKLLTFIKQLKENPSIIIKKVISKNQPHTHPTPPSKITVRPGINTHKSQTNVTLPRPSQQNHFKHKLGNIIGGTPTNYFSEQQSTPLPSSLREQGAMMRGTDTQREPKYFKPQKPTELTNTIPKTKPFVAEPTRSIDAVQERTVQYLPKENNPRSYNHTNIYQNKRNSYEKSILPPLPPSSSFREQGTVLRGNDNTQREPKHFKNLPLKPTELTKIKPFVAEPTTSIERNLHLPKSYERSGTPEEVYENIVTEKIDQHYEYSNISTDDEFDTDETYESSPETNNFLTTRQKHQLFNNAAISHIASRQPVPNNDTDFVRNSPVTNRYNFPQTQDLDDESHNVTPNRPYIPLQLPNPNDEKLNRRSPGPSRTNVQSNLQNIDDEVQNVRKCSVPNRLDIPVTNRPALPLPLFNSQSKSLNNLQLELEMENDGENSVEDSLGDYLDLQAETKQATKIRSHRSAQKTKINDLDCIIIKKEEKQSNHFFGSLSKLFSTKSKEFKQDAQSSNDYENHMMSGEKPSIQENIKSYLGRPLPELPPPELESPPSPRYPVINKLDQLSLTKTDTNFNKRYLIQPNVEPLQNISNQQELDISHDSLVYHNVNEVQNSEEETEDLSEYENTHSQTEQTKSNAHFLDDLALKLSLELRTRENLKNVPKTKLAPMHEPLYGNISTISAQQMQPSASAFLKEDNLTHLNSSFDEFDDEPDTIDAERNDAEDYDSNYIHPIFNINNEKFFRNTDRKGAKKLLLNLPEGSFLFRPSEKYFLALSIKHKEKFYNLGIERTPNNTIRLNADIASVSPEFGSLKAFVQYFTKEAVTFRDNGDLIEIFLNPAFPENFY